MSIISYTTKTDNMISDLVIVLWPATVIMKFLLTSNPIAYFISFKQPDNKKKIDDLTFPWKTHIG